MNITAYIIYIIITWLITVKVGHLFYKNGRYYILSILKGDEALTDFINKILLVCYYLTNLGYAALMLRFWKTITGFAELVSSVSSMTGRIVLSLAVIHYVNMYAIIIIGKRQQFLTHHKKYKNENWLQFNRLCNLFTCNYCTYLVCGAYTI